MVTPQQRWSRYVGAINYCIEHGLLIDIQDYNSGNVKRIKAKWDPYFYKTKLTFSKEAIIQLKPRKYKATELYYMIIEQIGAPIRETNDKEKQEYWNE